jgi:hypothetical protein
MFGLVVAEIIAMSIITPYGTPIYLNTEKTSQV